MTYIIVIVIFTAFAKINTRKIRFEITKEINTVVPLLSFYREEHEENYHAIYFIIKHICNDVMFK